MGLADNHTDRQPEPRYSTYIPSLGPQRVTGPRLWTPSLAALPSLTSLPSLPIPKRHLDAGPASPASPASPKQPPSLSPWPAPTRPRYHYPRTHAVAPSPSPSRPCADGRPPPSTPPHALAAPHSPPRRGACSHCDCAGAPTPLAPGSRARCRASVRSPRGAVPEPTCQHMHPQTQSCIALGSSCIIGAILIPSRTCRVGVPIDKPQHGTTAKPCVLSFVWLRAFFADGLSP
ncbi:hypothetical protein EJ04DRAFT_132310 [Polyplosphaeria fusca]|uniref:Uncharacterized protein n=1 Tax=Polyplosphaeria fusca TaxID=682080 RepID=A0A9P4UW98_9PLEO|nr:hypothetical protein EJ04DRAFT_132310 [Polyplosphaeria fusca]